MGRVKSNYILAIISAAGFFAIVITMVGLLLEDNIELYAIISTVGYLLACLGFLFLVGWAFLSGQFRDVEASKYKVLEAERE